MRIRHPKKGFSLIEFLIVIGIIGLLASLSVPSLLRSYNKSRAARIVTDLRAIRDVALNYNADQGIWPRSRGWGWIPPDFMPLLPAGTTFNLRSWNVRYAYTNYSNKSQKWKDKRGYSVVLRCQITNVALARIVKTLAPNMFIKVNINRKRGNFFIALE
jgi:prepilin-type N-terminal cleavage/methylation domain-containing protein